MDTEKKMSMQEASEKGLLSEDVAEEKREQLKELFPEVFTEDKIDFEQLRRVMGDWVEPGKERYGLNWPGKADCMKVIQAPSVATLKPDRNESVDFDTTENLFIEGDNLEVLKLLQKAYFGKVKMIYIDPPYNTGKEFIYPDKYQENLDTYLAYTGQVDDEGKKFSTNTDAGGRFHANWLNMMYPRLYLARNLLSDDGIILIAIDDNEHSNLKLLCNHIFGEVNFAANISWKHTQQSKNDEPYFSRNKNEILVYRKSSELGRLRFPRTAEDNKNYSNPDNDPKGEWRSGDVRSPNFRQTLRYNVASPSGKIIEPPENGWRWSEDSIREKIATGEIVFSKDESRIIRKIYLCEQEGRTPENVWAGDRFGTTRQANAELKELFDGTVPFDTPKPTALIESFLDLFAESQDFTVLDFFAGSSSTAHAVMKKNAKDGGCRRYIMVQLPEICDEDSDAFKAGYKTIAELGKQRIRKAKDKIANEGDVQLNFDEKESLDLGFKAFKLSISNFNIWEGDIEAVEDLAKQLELHVDHIDQASGPEDILYELLLKAGFELTTEVEKQTMAGKDVYAVADGALLICLDKEITPELIAALADANPLQVICLDEGFKGNDQLKTNAVQTFKSRAKADEEAIVFRTV